jgi:DNA helicase-2/ATP-dependent DNA helicase PcrA
VQDTNQLQYEWLEHLARGHGNLCCVGDPDQALYQWRGARPDLLLNFAEDWPGTHTVVLERNYRSTQPILDVANRVVAINPRPAPKTLESGSAGDPVEFNEYATSWDEAQQMSDDIAQRVRGGQDPREIAILVRSQRVMLQIEKALNARGVSYQVVGGQKFFAREEIRDLNAYIRLAHDTRDSLALQRIANKPVRGLGPKAVDQVIAAFEAGYGDLVEALREVAANGRRITQSAADGMNRLAWLIEQATAKAREGINPGELMSWLIAETDYVAWRRASGDESWRDRADNLRELAADAGEYRSIGSYLQQVAIMSAADASDDTRTVRLSTVHAAKGLEFETVFTPALENGVLPNAASLREHYGPAEERRICHVAWTRAKQELIVSFAQSRLGQAAEPSPFLFDAGLMDTARKGSGPRSAVMRQNQGRPQAPRPVKPGSYYDQAARSGETSRQSGIGLRGFHKRPKRTAS